MAHCGQMSSSLKMVSALTHGVRVSTPRMFITFESVRHIFLFYGVVHTDYLTVLTPYLKQTKRRKAKNLLTAKAGKVDVEEEEVCTNAEYLFASPYHCLPTA